MGKYVNFVKKKNPQTCVGISNQLVGISIKLRKEA